MLHLQIFIITRMNLMVLRFGHLIAPFKEIFNRKLHYNLVKLLYIKKEKNSLKENKENNPSVSHN